MEDNNAIAERPNDVNYEVAFNQMKETAQNLYERVKQLENTWMLQRADFLFKIIESDYFNKNIKDKAVSELSEFLFPIIKEKDKEA